MRVGTEGTESEGPRDMVRQKRRRREGTDTEPALVKALRQEVEELREEVERLREENEELREERAKPREENEGLKLSNAKLEARCQTPQEEEKEVKLPTEVWAMIAGKIDENDVCSFALVSRQLREAQVLAGRKLVTPLWNPDCTTAYFTEGWCAYWSRKFNVHETDPEVIREVLYVAARHGYLQVFEKYWSQGPQEKLSELWDEETCRCAAHGGHLEVIKWLRAKGCPWDKSASNSAAEGGHLEVLQWMRAQDPPCPWDMRVCDYAAGNGHLEVLRWARSQGCPWNKYVPWAAASNGHLEVLRWARSQGCPWDERAPCAAAEGGHLKVLVWLIKEGCPYDQSKCREAAVEGGERAIKLLEWLDE
ncbi:putative ankyrin repeat protein [Chloropicon roscoffensis]|uniref:Ankyrin repeat protein n=1 Tax=Chloropicon roscoffensis TaxID=1461544 RepID=A0AAX4PIF2_9CHLO